MLGAVFDLESRACCGVASSVACLGVITVKPPDQLTDVGIKMELKRCSESLGPLSQYGEELSSILGQLKKKKKAALQDLSPEA